MENPIAAIFILLAFVAIVYFLVHDQFIGRARLVRRKTALVLITTILVTAALTIYPPWVVEFEVVTPHNTTGVGEVRLDHNWIWSRQYEGELNVAIDWRTLLAEYAFVVAIAALLLVLMNRTDRREE